MRIGLIADIHGNLVALDAVLAVLDRERLDHLICLGDVAALGPRPAETLARLRERDCSIVLGNTDNWFLDPPLHDPTAGLSPQSAALTRWAIARLGDAERAQLRVCPSTLTVPLGDGRAILCCHGSPRSYNEVIAATTPDDTLSAILADHDAAIVVGGHTHIQLLRRHDARLIVNVGSVGLPGIGPGTPDLPVNCGVAWAEYGIIDASDAALRVDLRRLPLDLDAVLADARAVAMPEYDWWRGLWAVKH